GLCLRLDQPLLLREQPARHLPPPVLFLRRRLGDVPGHPGGQDPVLAPSRALDRLPGTFHKAEGVLEKTRMRGTQEPGGLVLIVEDNRNISEMVGEYLDSRGFEVDYAADGLDGYRLASENNYDVIVLDLMLPRLDGIEVCKRLREEARKSTPVLMLTARDTLEEKLTGLGAGADDYLVKPFAVQELEARLRALIRRERRQVGSEVLKVADLVLDPASLRATRGGTE